jgi:hypothetical protein
VVSVTELVMAVNVALRHAPVSACLPGDTNRDGQVTIDELIAAVDHALRQCTHKAPIQHQPANARTSQ